MVGLISLVFRVTNLTVPKWPAVHVTGDGSLTHCTNRHVIKKKLDTRKLLCLDKEEN